MQTDEGDAHWTRFLDIDVCNCAAISDVVGVKEQWPKEGRAQVSGTPLLTSKVCHHALPLIPLIQSPKMTPNDNMCSDDVKQVNSKTVHILVSNVMSSGLFLFVCLLGLDSVALVHPLPCQMDFSFSQRKGKPRDARHDEKMKGSPPYGSSANLHL